MKLYDKLNLNYLLKLLKNVPQKVLIFSLLPSALIFLYLSLLGASKYSSEMSISLSDPGGGGILSSSQSLFSPVGMSGDSNISKLRLFLESKEATSRISSILPLIEIYRKGDIINGYKFKSDIESLHKFRLRNLSISLESDSNSLVINTTAFNGKDAFNINMALIVAINHYLNRNTSISNEIIETNKICELQSLRYKLSTENVELDDAKELISKNELLSGSDLIIELTEKRRTFCTNQSLTTTVSDTLPNLTSDLLFSAYEDALKSITTARLEKWNNKENLEIISEPNIPTKPDSANSLLKATGFFIVSILLLYSISIMRRVFKEFEL